jgi:hypothetical protein
MLKAEDATKLKEITQRYRRGDHLEDDEMKLMIRAIRDALPFLWSSPDYALARQQAIRDEMNLKSYLDARKLDRRRSA